MGFSNLSIPHWIFSLSIFVCTTLLSCVIEKAMRCARSQNTDPAGVRPIPKLLLGFAFMANVIFTIFCQNFEILTLVVYSTSLSLMISLLDSSSGRIPLAVLAAGCIMGGISSMHSLSASRFLFGGLGCACLAVLIYFSGKWYSNGWAILKEPHHPVFGFGDVIAAGAIGMVCGPVFGLIIFLGGLILAVIYGAGSALVFKKSFRKLRIRLGIFFYLSTVLLNALILWFQSR
jgi:hypothetical protein